MGTDVQNDSRSIETEFIRVIKDFSQYLAFQKQIGNTFLGISEKSKDQINNWGNTWETQTRDLFLSQGFETAAVFIIDSEGSFFKGKSGDLLIKILNAMNLSSDSVFICNADDFRSVKNKIKMISPEIIITLGAKAAQSLLNIRQPLEQFQGKFHEYNGIKVMPTLHPSFLLEQPQFKRRVWEDMKLVMELTGLKDGS